jgi:hypothetical protein
MFRPAHNVPNAIAAIASRFQRFVTIGRSAPLGGGGTARTLGLIWPSDKEKYFCRGGLTLRRVTSDNAK